MARNAKTLMIELVESCVLTWEEIARECLMQMNCDEAKSVADVLGLKEEDEDA